MSNVDNDAMAAAAGRREFELDEILDFCFGLFDFDFWIFG